VHAEADRDVEIVGREVDDEEQDGRGEVHHQDPSGLQKVLHRSLHL
jgi:hypothetical protein